MIKRITVNITKSILQKAANRPTGSIKSDECPVTLALKHIFPKAGTSILNVSLISGDRSTSVPMPQAGVDFVKKFDMVDGFPEKIMALDEVSFELEVPVALYNKYAVKATEKEFA